MMIKRILSFLLAVMMLAAMCAIPATAEEDVHVLDACCEEATALSVDEIAPRGMICTNCGNQTTYSTRVVQTGNAFTCPKYVNHSDYYAARKATYTCTRSTCPFKTEIELARGKYCPVDGVFYTW